MHHPGLAACSSHKQCLNHLISDHMGQRTDMEMDNPLDFQMFKLTTGLAYQVCNQAAGLSCSYNAFRTILVVLWQKKVHNKDYQAPAADTYNCILFFKYCPRNAALPCPAITVCLSQLPCPVTITSFFLKKDC